VQRPIPIHLRKNRYLAVLPALLLLAWMPAAPDTTQRAAPPIVVDDFEAYRVEGLPTRWKFVDKAQQLIPVSEKVMSKEEYFVVLREQGNKFLRAVTRDRAHRLLLSRQDVGDWNLNRHPYLRWTWRAMRLPAGAREDREPTNDTGGALYVTFSRDWLGRPRSIKYSYSSTLPVGTVVSYGRLKVIVVASGRDGLGQWKVAERNVVEDYRNVFGEEPPASPVSVMLWSDSNSVHDVAEVDFDNIELAPAPATASW
jgi:hypothetical protein